MKSTVKLALAGALALSLSITALAFNKSQFNKPEYVRAEIASRLEKGESLQKILSAVDNIVGASQGFKDAMRQLVAAELIAAGQNPLDVYYAAISLSGYTPDSVYLGNTSDVLDAVLSATDQAGKESVITALMKTAFKADHKIPEDLVEAAVNAGMRDTAIFHSALLAGYDTTNADFQNQLTKTISEAQIAQLQNKPSAAGTERQTGAIDPVEPGGLGTGPSGFSSTTPPPTGAGGGGASRS